MCHCAFILLSNIISPSKACLLRYEISAVGCSAPNSVMVAGAHLRAVTLGDIMSA